MAPKKGRKGRGKLRFGTNFDLRLHVFWTFFSSPFWGPKQLEKCLRRGPPETLRKAQKNTFFSCFRVFHPGHIIFLRQNQPKFGSAKYKKWSTPRYTPCHPLEKCTFFWGENSWEIVVNHIWRGFIQKPPLFGGCFTAFSQLFWVLGPKKRVFWVPEAPGLHFSSCFGPQNSEKTGVSGVTPGNPYPGPP